MDTKLTLIAPEDIPDVIAMLREWRLNRSSPSRSMQSGLVTAPTPIYVRNVSGLVIPPYACMQAVGTVDDTETTQNYIEVDQPADVDGTAGGYLFNGPEEIGVGDDGVAQNSRVVRAIKDTGTATAGDSWQPIVNDWTIAAGGTPFTMVGDDDIATDCVKVIYAGGGGGGVKIVQATSGIAARSGVTLGSATCTEFKIVAGDLATNTATLTVLNMSLLAIPTNAYVLAHLEAVSGQWIAQAVINGLRYQSPNLQYTIDGTTWVTWATANTTCPP